MTDRRRWGQLEADMQRSYGLDLRRCVADPDMGARRLYVLASNLPPDAALWRDGMPGWDARTELAAAQLELTHTSLRAFLKAHGSKKNYPALEVPRPEKPVTPEQRRRMSRHNIRAVLLGGASGG